MQTTVRKYHFDVSEPEEAVAWRALKEKLKSWPHRMHSLTADGESYYQTGRKLDGQTITLESKHLFSNQWNTEPIEGVSSSGLRVFDWAQDALFDGMGRENKKIKQGYYLDQTAEMREVRRNTIACGYCSKQEPAAKGYVFCPHCLDSECLKEGDLLLTRMRPVEVDRFKEELPPLTEAEAAYLLPLYREAQLHGTTERGKARIAKQRADIEAKYRKAKIDAEQEHKGALWVADHFPGMLSNWIYYNHTGQHSFGWRRPLSAGEVSVLLDAISEFPFGYEIHCEDGRVLKGES